MSNDMKKVLSFIAMSALLTQITVCAVDPSSEEKKLQEQTRLMQEGAGLKQHVKKAAKWGAKGAAVGATAGALAGGVKGYSIGVTPHKGGDIDWLIVNPYVLTPVGTAVGAGAGGSLEKIDL